MNNFKEEVEEIKKLNFQYESYWRKEFEGREYSQIIANPDNFEEDVFYHQANSEFDMISIVENGFNIKKVSKVNCGVGAGLYLGRDKNALINFYDPDWNYNDYTIKINGQFKFYDGIKNHIPENPNEVVNQGFDGIRYFDIDATGEEFVVFNIEKAMLYLINEQK